MANTVFKLRRSSVAGKVPNTATLSIGELGLNLTDKILYSSDGTNVFEIGSNNTIIRVTNVATIANATVNSLAFTNSGFTATEGMLVWNPDENTLDLGLSGNTSILQLGQETLYRVRNATGSTINNGTVVMANGTLGSSGRIKVSAAVANGAFPSHYIMGVATENITTGNDGYVTAFGKVRGLDTSAWADGTILYADPAVPGGLTSTKPQAPNHKTIIAIVVHSHASNGVLFVRPTFASDLADDEQVELTSLANGDMLVYKSANGRFENTKDLVINSITANGNKGSAGQVLTSNGTGTYWANGGTGGFTNGQSISVNNFVMTGAFTANSSNGTSGQVLTSNGSSVYWSSVSSTASASALRQQNVGDGVTTSFAVAGGYVANNINVFLNGVLLRNGDEVNVSSGTNFVITPAPPNGSLIDVIGTSAIQTNGINTIISQQFTGNGAANSFAVSGGYVPNQLQVYLNGVKQVPGVDVDVTSGANVGFYVAPGNGYIVDVYGQQVAIVATSNVLSVGANVTISTSTISVGNSSVNTQIVAGNVYLNGSTLIIGNTASNVTINATAVSIGAVQLNTSSYSGTANNTSFVGTVSAANVVSNAQLSANLGNYQTSAGLAANVATLTANNALNANNASYLGGTAASAYSKFAWAGVQATNFSANSNYGYPVSTASGAVTVTLPASPTAGDRIIILDYNNSAGANNIVVNPNGNKINGITVNATISVNRASLNLIYVDSTQGWLNHASTTQSAVNQSYTVNYLVVAGGGGGGQYIGGGGGAGGLLASSMSVTTGSSYTVTIGGGGSGGAGSGGSGSNGTNSTLTGVTAAVGGGGGASGESVGGQTGGSGGGQGRAGGGRGGSIGTGTVGQGNNGGSGSTSGGSDGAGSGGGGGGAGAVGGNASGSTGGTGGIGYQSSITGTATYYGGGGGGGTYNGTGGTGGNGGGGKGGSGSSADATAGGTNTGGGGGSGGYPTQNPQPGGSGVVIISYASAIQLATGGAVTSYTSGPTTYWVHKFTTGGTFTA